MHVINIFIAITVIKPSEYLCSGEHDKPIEKLLPKDGYISNKMADRCGALDMPYVMRLPHGQRVNLSLLDFHLPLSTDSHHTSAHITRCDVYATVREPSTSRTVEVCGGQSRNNVVFVSSSNVLEIYMNEKMSDGTRHFLLKYEGTSKRCQCSNGPLISPTLRHIDPNHETSYSFLPISSVYQINIRVGFNVTLFRRKAITGLNWC